MDITQFLIFFLLLTVCGALTVTGWYFITRGDIEVLPDGSFQKVGKIFKAWYFFWTRERPYTKIIFYKGKELTKLLAEISSNYTNLSIREADDRFQVVSKNTPDLLWKGMPEIEAKWDICLKSERSSIPNDPDYFSAYRVFPVYVFPEIIRTPLAECATCFSSIYGSLFYWFAVWLVEKPLFNWSSMPGFAAVFFWVTFCFELSVLNTALAKKF